eukprot:m.108136 g.108136  ORF g.108136 m.108136 type:complete len:81 (-) comp15330_c0_seq8:1178-1420(-)
MSCISCHARTDDSILPIHMETTPCFCPVRRSADKSVATYSNSHHIARRSPACQPDLSSPCTAKRVSQCNGASIRIDLAGI